LILGGAVGNVIDSTFYGVLLNNHPMGSPTPWFHGQVIDMLFFPIFEFYWPEWVPYVGGNYFLFFSPVFNIADSSIFIGVVVILVFQRRFFKDRFIEESDATSSTEINIPENTNPSARNGENITQSVQEAPDTTQPAKE
jgi:signal peptidase II